MTQTSTFSELRLDGVSRQFAGTDALKDLDLTIRAGEFIALLGPSGCGKSTALNCLAGLLPLTGGSIWQDEKRIDTLPPERRGFGMVFQNYALFPHMTVRSNIAFGLQMRRLPKQEVAQRTDEAIRLVQLEEHAGKLPGQLSGGQQQRVAIARAVVLEPSLVLMDEPLSNLDAKLRLEMRTEIRRLHQSLGLTTVYVTHDQEEALSMADRLVVLRKGKVQQIGTPEDLHTRPANWHVADFMGFRNLVELTVSGADGDLVVVEDKGLKLAATPVEPLSTGDAVVVAVRPEDLVVRTGAGGHSSPSSSVDAVVEVVEYQGRELAVEVRTREGQRLHVRTGERLAPGDAVTLDVDPVRLLAFPRGDEPLAGRATLGADAEPRDKDVAPALSGSGPS
ncbi:ABC transporter ATP-binding protein [Knoellia sp. Soil729]|uniref:ABC transporter ATP-binding protein n=1 Tax=Knoellia sp. Soil729 TaxID=1736394 RepID=UPI0009EAC1A5|nr:ABC transporter ATP-binding protein [Knoellia sp. Soil729]